MDIRIADRVIGDNKPVFIIAELSANHLQRFEIAKETLIAAKESGADAIKLQTYTPDTMTIDCDNKYFRINQGTIWDGKTLYDLYRQAYTPWDWYPELKKVADDLGVIIFSTPFDLSSVDFLERYDPPVYKVASFEIRDIPLIQKIASLGKPIIVSTGIAALEDIMLFMETCRKQGNDKIIMLKCTSSYPAPLEEMNLYTIPDMVEKFGCIVGLSDHSARISVSVAAVALGAKVIESHFILDRSMGGPDASFSLEPSEFHTMVTSVREVEKALGKADYELSGNCLKSREFGRSLFVVEDIKKGELFTARNVRSIRPGFGMHPKMYDQIIGMKAKKDIKRGTPLAPELIGS